MKKYIIGLFLLSLNVKAVGNIVVRNTTNADIPVLIFQGSNCKNERLTNFMEMHKISPIKNEDPYKAWASVQWAKLAVQLEKLKDSIASKDISKLKPATQCLYVSQGFLGKTDYTTVDAFVNLGYLDIKPIPSPEKPQLLDLKAKSFALPVSSPVKVVFYREPADHMSYGTRATATYVCDAMPGQEVTIDRAGDKLKCTINKVCA